MVGDVAIVWHDGLVGRIDEKRKENTLVAREDSHQVPNMAIENDTS